MKRRTAPDASYEERLSRFLCMVLRHKPQVVGVTLDDGGWIPIRDLVSAVQTVWKKVRAALRALRRGRQSWSIGKAVDWESGRLGIGKLVDQRVAHQRPTYQSTNMPTRRLQ